MSRAGIGRDVAVGIVLLALLVALPLVFTKPALRDFLIYVMAYGLLAMSLNLLVGLTRRVVRVRRRTARRASSAATCFETADLDRPMRFAASVKPPASITCTKACISARRSISRPYRFR